MGGAAAAFRNAFSIGLILGREMRRVARIIGASLVSLCLVLTGSLYNVAAAADTPVVHKVIIVQAFWPGVTPDNVNIQEIAAVVEGEVSSYWSTQSGGLLSFQVSESVKWIEVSKGPCFGVEPASSNSFWKEVSSRSGAKPGVNTHVLVYVPASSGCKASGSGSVGSDKSAGGYVWINGSIYPSLITHELGHNLGLGHSASLDCIISGSLVVRDPNDCTMSEYGDVGDIMGVVTPNMTGNLNPVQLSRINNPNNVLKLSPAVPNVVVSGNGVPGLNNTSAVFESGAGTFYFVYGSGKVGCEGDAGSGEGVLVYWASKFERSDKNSYLLVLRRNLSGVAECIMKEGEVVALNAGLEGVSVRYVNHTAFLNLTSTLKVVNVGNYIVDESLTNTGGKWSVRVKSSANVSGYFSSLRIDKKEAISTGYSQRKVSIFSNTNKRSYSGLVVARDGSASSSLNYRFNVNVIAGSAASYTKGFNWVESRKAFGGGYVTIGNSGSVLFNASNVKSGGVIVSCRVKRCSFEIAEDGLLVERIHTTGGAGSRFHLITLNNLTSKGSRIVLRSLSTGLLVSGFVYIS